MEIIRPKQLLWILLLLFPSVCTDDPGRCPLVIQPDTVVVRYGDPVSANCTMSEVHMGIGWEAAEGSVDMKQDVQFITWRLEHLTDWEIEPKCFVNFMINTKPLQCEEELKVIVYKTPDSVAISAVGHVGPMLEGEQYQLQCEVQNIAPVQNLTVKWYKGETLEDQTTYDDLTKTPLNVSSTLLITPTSADDGAQYSCVAELELGPEGPELHPADKSEPLTITVHYKPIIECQDHVQLEEGETLSSASCRIKGNPIPVVTWHGVQSDLNSSTALTRIDAGKYTLMAENTYGTANHRMEIDVLYKPSTTECPSHVELKEGESLSSELCRAEGNPPPVVRWYRVQSESDFNISTPLTRRDAGEYLFTATNNLGNISVGLTVGYGPIFSCNDNYELKENESLNCTADGYPEPQLTWLKEGKEVNLPDQLTRRDAGQYILTANNTHGTINHTLEIDVLYPPEFEQVNEKVTVAQGEEVILSCTAKGNPIPTINWNTSSAETHLATRERQNTLTISKASSHNAGIYTCIATNYLGTASRRIMVSVPNEDPGRCPLVIWPDTVVVRFGDPLSVNCTVSEDHMGIGWEASEGSVDMKQDVQFITWSLEHLTDWKMEPKCYGNFLINAKPLQCEKELKVIVYKTPDSISISAVGHVGPMLEGEQYQMQCEVQNIAPVQYLTVKWYKGETLENETTYDDLTKTPVNVSSTLLITPTSTDDGAQYSCVAELELGPEGPEHHPADKSEPLTITVHYPPEFEQVNEKVTVAQGEEVILSCTAKGNPIPTINWNTSSAETHLATRERQNTLTISKASSHNAGIYTCIATNYLGTASRRIMVSVPNEDYVTIVMVVLGIILLLLLLGLIFYCIKRKRSRGQYYFSPAQSDRRTDNSIPLMPANSNGIA